MSFNKRVLIVIKRQIDHLINLGNIKIELNETNLFENYFEMVIKNDSLWSNYKLKGKIIFPPDYPYKPPSIYFTSDIFHPNVYEDGKVCLSILRTEVDETGYIKKEELWSPAVSLELVFVVLENLITEPNLESPANLDACLLYKRNKEELKKILDSKLNI